MPGGAGIVAFESTDAPEAAAAFINFLAREDNAARFAVETRSITAHQGLQASGIDYGDTEPAVAQALSTFAASIAKSAQTSPSRGIRRTS